MAAECWKQQEQIRDTRSSDGCILESSRRARRAKTCACAQNLRWLVVVVKTPVLYSSVRPEQLQFIGAMSVSATTGILSLLTLLWRLQCLRAAEGVGEIISNLARLQQRSSNS